MSDGFRVDLEQLDAFAAHADERRTGLTTSTCTLSTAGVGHDSFGRIPVVADRVREAYEGHVQGCVDAVRAAVETAGAIAVATRRLQQNYGSAEFAAGSDMDVIDDTLGAI
jgi:hypothetical protein